jgi:uncharacterized protein (TIGR03435 family)
MQKIGRLFLITAAFAFAVIPLLSQTAAQQTPAARKPSFEVISVKQGAPGSGFRGGGPRGNSLILTNAPARMLLQLAYQRTAGAAPGIQLQVVGAPSWMDSEFYDIQAKADCSGGPIPREQMQLMIQSLLEDRFQLKAHHETRELPIYNLVVVKEGKLKASDDQTAPVGPVPGGATLCGPVPEFPGTPFGPRGGPGARGGPFDPSNPPPLPPLPRGAMRMMMNPTTGMTMEATSAPIANIVNLLQGSAGRPIIDKTGLKGLFDFKLNFSAEGLPGIGTPFGPAPPPPPAPAAPGGGGLNPTTNNAADPIPSLFTAIQEQLGLKLESTKGPVEVLVIDSAQKPTEN